MIAYRPLIILLVITIIAIVVIKRRLDAGRSHGNGSREEEETADRDLNDEFFRNIGEEKALPFLKVFTPQDRMLVRSILDSAGIPSYQGSHHVGDLLPGIRIHGDSETLVYIYECHRTDAEVLVIDYLKNRVESLTGEPVTDLSDLTAIISDLNLTPATGNQMLPEFAETGDEGE